MEPFFGTRNEVFQSKRLQQLRGTMSMAGGGDFFACSSFKPRIHVHKPLPSGLPLYLAPILSVRLPPIQLPSLAFPETGRLQSEHCKPWYPNPLSMLFWLKESILDSAHASPKEPEGDSEFSHLAPLAPLPVEPSYEQVQSVPELKWSYGLVLLRNHSILLQFPLDCSLGSQ